MQRLVRAAFLLAASIPSWAQDACDYESKDRFDVLARALSAAKSCAAAVAKWQQCAFGSSADTQLTPIVVAKCEKTFLDKLSPATMERYTQEMQLCAYRYARQEGTMWMAIAAGCQVDVAAEFAANPATGSQPAARASFDCDKAQTALEKAICSDIRLGHADIVLSRVYSTRLKNPQEDRPVLIQSEKQWLQSLPAKCGVSAVPLSQKSLNCVRNEFELRFTMLDSCLGTITECLQSPAGEDHTASAAESASNPRASFDCEKPSTAMAIVICADARLGQTDIKLAQAYHDAGEVMAAQHKNLVESERQWLRFVNRTCPMGAIGGIPSYLTRACVRTAFETRIGQLQTCPQKELQDRISCLNDFQLFEKKQSAQ
ncbi:MAG TPA: lysozyme inhibitor LprI family protein [Candidatus Angelobacter sp.]